MDKFLRNKPFWHTNIKVAFQTQNQYKILLVLLAFKLNKAKIPF